MTNPAVVWVSAGLLLCIAEMVAPGVFLLWLGIAALLTGAAAFLLPLGMSVQFVLFSVLALSSVAIGRRWTRSSAIPSEDPLLNDRTARLIGQQVIVEEAITAGYGRVRVGDGVWPAAGPDMPVGASAIIRSSRDGRLIVEPAA